QNRAIDFGIVSVDLFLALVPLRLIGLKLLAALQSLIENQERMVDGGLRAEHLWKFQEHSSGLGIHLDIAYELGLGALRLEVFDHDLDLESLFPNFRELLRFGLDCGRGRLSAASSPCRTGLWLRRML